jgi:GTPase SAR1 family protein/Ca2+-binding EF-hand superfamily protein
MTRVRLPPDPETNCVTTIVDSQNGDTALLNVISQSQQHSLVPRSSSALDPTAAPSALQTLMDQAGATAAAATAPLSPGGGGGAARGTAMSSATGGGATVASPTSTMRKVGATPSTMTPASPRKPASASATMSALGEAYPTASVVLRSPSSTVESVDSIILVYDLDRVETFFRLENHWLPLLERCYAGKVSLNENENCRTVLIFVLLTHACRSLIHLCFQVPVIVAENKMDLYRPSSTAGMSDDQALARKRQQIVSLMQRFPFVRQCIKCSAKNLLRVDDVFVKAQQAVIYPFTPPLYDLETGQLTIECQRAFTRIFRMYDRDHDGLLSDAELDRFQGDTYHVAVFECDFAAWKKVVTRSNPDEEVLVDGKFTIAGFLAIFDVFISQNRLDVVWQALRKFGYDDDLNLHVPESVIAPPDDSLGAGSSTTTSSASSSWRLSSSAKRFLSALFHQFDTNKDGVLTPDDMMQMFSILPPPALPPWHPIRAPELFQDCFSRPIDSLPLASSLLLGAGGGSVSSPSDSPSASVGQSLILPPVSSALMSQSLSNSGISILSAGDSLPSVNVPFTGTSRPLTFLEWMGYWHVVATISPVVARSELFKLGHLEEPKTKTELSLRRKGASRWKKAVTPTNFVYDATLRSREIRVLVLGSQGTGKTALLNYLRGRDAGSQSTKTRPTTSPETSTTYVKLKRKPHKVSSDEEGEEFVVHLVFTDVPEAAAASQEAHFRNLAELFGSSVATSHPQERMCDLAMLVFDCNKSASLSYVKDLEKSLLTKETPRVFVATKADKQNSSSVEEGDDTRASVLAEAESHCQEQDLESPLIMSADDFSSGTDRTKALDHLARCALSEPGLHRLRARPHEEQKRREAATRRRLWFGGIVSVGIIVAVGVGLLWGGSSKERKGSRWFQYLFRGSAAAETAASS